MVALGARVREVGSADTKDALADFPAAINRVEKTRPGLAASAVDHVVNGCGREVLVREVAVLHPGSETGEPAASIDRLHTQAAAPALRLGEVLRPSRGQRRQQAGDLPASQGVLAMGALRSHFRN